MIEGQIEDDQENGIGREREKDRGSGRGMDRRKDRGGTEGRIERGTEEALRGS